MTNIKSSTVALLALLAVAAAEAPYNLPHPGPNQAQFNLPSGPVALGPLLFPSSKVPQSFTLQSQPQSQFFPQQSFDAQSGYNYQQPNIGAFSKALQQNQPNFNQISPPSNKYLPAPAPQSSFQPAQQLSQEYQPASQPQQTYQSAAQPFSNFQSYPQSQQNYQPTSQSNFQSGPQQNYHSGLHNGYHSSPHNGYHSGPQSNFATPLNSNFQSAPQQSFQSSPQSSFQSIPQSNFQTAPQQNFQSAPQQNYQSLPLQNSQNAPQQSYGAPQFQSQHQSPFQSQPQQQIQSQFQPNFQSQPSSFSAPHLESLPLQQSQQGYNYAPQQNSAPLSSYQADLNQYSYAPHNEALDFNVIDQLQKIIKEDEHNKALKAGYPSYISAVKLEGAQPSIEVTNFITHSQLPQSLPAPQQQQQQQPQQQPINSALSLSLQASSPVSLSGPIIEFGVPEVTVNTQSDNQQGFSPSAKPAPVYGPANKK